MAYGRGVDLGDLGTMNLKSVLEKAPNEREVYLEILDTINDAVYIMDADTRTLFVNKAYERLSGAGKENFIGKKMADIVEEGLLDHTISSDIVASKSKVECNQTLYSGRKVLVTGSPILSKDGDLLYIVSIARDLNELNTLRDSLAEKQSSLDALKYKISEEDHIKYRSDVMHQVVNLARRVSNYSNTVLITGPTGSGKNVVAHFIHNVSPRKDQAYVEVNCSSIPPSLIESELFGYEKGAFTGSSKEGKTGLFEEAHGGTLFLDEIAELPFDIQAKLLDVMQDKRFRKVGGTKEIEVDVRIIAATNKDLWDMVQEGTFREDLYYRLNVIPIEVPPLSERKEDIAILADHFITQLNQLYKEDKSIDHTALRALYTYSWPGNVRELKNIIERTYILTNKKVLTREEFAANLEIQKEAEEDTREYEDLPLAEAVKKLEIKLMQKAFAKAKTAKGAAEILGIDPSTFVRKRQKYNMEIDKKIQVT